MSIYDVIPVSVADYRRRAKRRLPGFLFHYLDGGANDEDTMVANVSHFRRFRLRQRVMRNVDGVDTSTILAGRPSTIPVALAPTTQVILYKMDPSAIPDWCRLPGVVIASDAMMVPGDWDSKPDWNTPYDKIPNTHPRLSGTHGTCLRIAREHDIPLMHILAASSYNPAKYLGATGLEAMKMRGRLQQGMVADITILDPAAVRDNATYVNGTAPTTGIPYVIVNGKTVVKDSKVLKGVNLGQPIRFPVEEKPRFESLSLDKWKAEYLVAPTGFHALDFGNTH